MYGDCGEPLELTKEFGDDAVKTYSGLGVTGVTNKPYVMTSIRCCFALKDYTDTCTRYFMPPSHATARGTRRETIEVRRARGEASCAECRR